MKSNKFLFLSTLIFVIGGCQLNDKDHPPISQTMENSKFSSDDAQEVVADVRDPADKKSAEAIMHDTDGNVIGTVAFYQKDKSVLVEGLIQSGLTPGFHGFHIHENGMCDPYDPEGPFASAGGHYNPEDTSHPDHAGDMLPLYALEDGSAYLLAALDRFDAKQLAHENRSVIVHANPDNFANIPERYHSENSKQGGPDEETLKAGDAGGRIACGVIKTNVN